MNACVLISMHAMVNTCGIIIYICMCLCTLSTEYDKIWQVGHRAGLKCLFFKSVLCILVPLVMISMIKYINFFAGEKFLHGCIQFAEFF